MVTLDPDHGDTEGSELLRKPKADLSHSDDDDMSGSWHDTSADERNTTPREKVLDYAGSECGGEPHHQQRGDETPDEVCRFVG